MDNSIYFAVGFKSFDITRSCGTTEIWYEWTERSRNFIRRTTFNKMTMEWISLSLREASKVNVNFVRRWKRRVNFSETFCSRNFNKFGWCISIVSLRGEKKINGNHTGTDISLGWNFIADKIEVFLKKQDPHSRAESRLAEKNLPYSEAARSFKWLSREGNEDI